MTSKKDVPNQDKNKPGEKRPHATLNLKATELKSSEKQSANPKDVKTIGDKTRAQAGDRKPDAKPTTAQTTAKSATNEKQKTTSTSATGDKKTSKTSSTTQNKPVETPRKSGSGVGGFLSHMAAAIIGAAGTLFAADSILPSLLNGAPGASANLSGLEQRLAQLEKSSSQTTPGANGGPSRALTEQLAATDARLAELEKISAAFSDLKTQQDNFAEQAKALTEKVEQRADPESAEGRLASLEGQLKVLSEAVPADGNGKVTAIPQLAAITGRLADLEKTLGNQMTALRTSVAKDVEKRITTTAEASVAAKSGTERLDRELATVKTDTAQFSQQLATLRADTKRVSEKLRAVQDETGALRSNLNSLQDDLTAKVAKSAKPADIAAAVTGVSAKIASLSSKLDNVVATENERTENAKKIVLSLELANLKRALSRGQTYATELAGVKSVADTSLDLTILEKYKNDGVPTLPQLQSAFRPLAHRIIDAETTPEDSSVIERLLSGAKSVVRVRKVNHAPDDKSVEAVVSRMDTALQDGDLTTVMSESKNLSSQATTPAQDWLDQAQALAQVNTTLASLEKQLKQSLGGQKQ